MVSKEALVQEWLDIDPFKPNELKAIKALRPKPNKYSLESIEQMHKCFFDMLPYGHIDGKSHEISFFDRATDAINSLFQREVDDNTLVIVSNNEHENVVKAYKACKNIYVLDFDTEIIPCKLNKLYTECSKYHKIFVYVIGTQVSNGIITPQLFFEKLKNWLEYNQKKYKIIIDDVHGMFIVPRDYRLFDYIIYTCHALITDFNMGILIARQPSTIVGYHFTNWGFAYLEAVRAVIEHHTKFYAFKYIMNQYFAEEIASGKLTLNANTAPHIFAPEIHGLNIDKKTFDEAVTELKKYDMRFEAGFDEEGQCNSRIYLRIREGQYFVYPEKLIPGLEMVKSILDTIE